MSKLRVGLSASPESGSFFLVTQKEKPIILSSHQKRDLVQDVTETHCRLCPYYAENQKNWNESYCFGLTWNENIDQPQQRHVHAAPPVCRVNNSTITLKLNPLKVPHYLGRCHQT